MTPLWLMMVPTTYGAGWAWSWWVIALVYAVGGALLARHLFEPDGGARTGGTHRLRDRLASRLHRRGHA